MDENQRLRDRVEELEMLLGKDTSLASKLCAAYQIEPEMADVLALIFNRNFVSHQSMFTVLFGARPDCDQPDPRVMDVQICKLRRKLRPYGITIKTQWGQGWSMPVASKDRLRAMLRALPRSHADMPAMMRECMA